ncbi:MAG: autotransporter-associated beta strand repeat-containing protein, partial [Zoogloea sp.]|nr:autotransporter-associated beta strand repeat-containing protein [Zoogloea sp.]
LVASTLSASTADLLSGRAVFNAAPGGSGAVRNAGSIISAPGGSVSLIGTQVSNSGSIATPGGTTGLIAGERVSVDFEGDGLVRYQVDVGAARALVEQSGQISADGGRVALQAGARDALVDTVLNVDGVVRARGISQRGGEIYLDGGAHGSVMVSGMLDASGTAPGTAGGQLRVLGENVGLIGGARLDASGDAGGGSVLVGGNYQGSGPEHNATRAFVGSGVTINADALSRGDGGRVITWADDWTRFYGTISARGGAVGGDGGFVEVSGKQNLAFAGSVVTSAPRGRTGTLLLDPGDLYVGANPGGGIQPAIDTDGTAGFLFEANGGPLLRRDFYVLASSLSSDSKYVLRAQDNVFFNADVAFGTTGGDAAKFVSVEAGEAIRSEPGVTSISTAGGALSLNAGTTIDIGAAINTNGGVLTINSAGAAALSGGVTGVGSSLVKQGAGELSLSGSNTYSGGTIIRVGTLRTAAASALPEGGAVSLEGSAVLNLDDKTQGIGNLSGASGTRIALGAAGTGGLAVNQTSDDTFAGQITGSGPASGTAALSKTGAGVLTLSGANSFTGLTQVSEGALRVTASNALAAASSLEVTGTGTFEIDGVALNSLASLTLTGGLAGLETLAGRGTASYGGTVTMVGHARMETAGASDTLTLGGQIDGTMSPPDAAPILQKVGGGVLVLDGTGSLFYPQILAGTLRATSDGVLPNTETLVGPGATLDIANTTQSIAHLSGGDAASRVLLGASGQLTVNQGLENAYAGSISGGAASVFAKAGNATLHLSGASPDYFGVTRVQAGTLSVSGSGNVLGSGGVEVSDGATLDIDAVNLGVTSLQLTGSGVGGSGALTGAGAARYDGTVSLNDPGPVVLGVADGGYLTLGGPLSGGVAMSVVKQGLGTLGLRDSAGFGGGTTIAAGTLVAQHASALGGGGVLVNDGASLLIDSVTLTTGGLTLNGRGVQEGGALQGAGTAAHAGAVTLNTASAIGAAAGSTLTLNNPLTGPGGLAKVGSGRLDLTAGSSYAGGTTIEAGTLVAQHASALGGGGVLVNDGASLLIDSVTLTTGGLTLNGRGVQEGGALQGAGTAAHAGAVRLDTASAIGAAAGSTLTLNNPLTGPGGLAKVDSGRLDLTAGSSYAGGTTIEAGTLVAQHASALGGGGVLVNDGASLLIDSVTLTTG